MLLRIKSRLALNSMKIDCETTFLNGSSKTVVTLAFELNWICAISVFHHCIKHSLFLQNRAVHSSSSKDNPSKTRENQMFKGIQ